MLHADVFGRIGCQVDARSYIGPLMYANDGEYICGHSTAGMTLRRLVADA